MIRGPRLRAGAALLVAGLALALGPGATAAPVAGSSPVPAATPGASTERAPVGAGALAVRIESISPSIPHEGDNVTLRGTIANTSDQPVAGVRAVLRVSPTPIPSRGEITEILAGEGQRLGVTVPAATASDNVAVTLAPGGASPFAVSAELDDLHLPAAGAYMVGVEALGNAGSGLVRQDLDRTFLPWWPVDTATSHLLITLLWPLAGAPLRDARGVLLNETPAVEMSPAGRLDVLLAAVAEHPGVASTVVDPQVLEAARDLADGYLVASADGDPTTGTRSREVGQWLQVMRTVAADSAQHVNAMLYGSPDVVAARQGRALAPLLRQRPLADQLTAEALGRRLPSDVVLMPDGTTDAASLRSLARSDVGAVVLADTTMPVATPSFFTPSGDIRWISGDDALPVLLTDSGLDATLRMPLTADSEQVAARQRLLAETLTTTLELPQTQRLLVASPDADWGPPIAGASMVLDTIDAAPWLDPTSLNAAVAREPSTVPHVLAAYSEDAAAAQLPAASISRARGRAADLTVYAGALSDPGALPDVTRTAPTRILSSWFRGRQDEQDALLRVVSRQTRQLLRSVRIVSSGAITVSGSSGIIPVTVENLGPAAVEVGLTLTGSPAQLFTADPVPPFRIEPGRRTSVEVPAEVNAAGPIPVTVQATTMTGDSFGVPVTLTVSSSAYANAARVLVQVSLAILLITVLIHGVRRARRRGTAPGSGGGSAARRAGPVPTASPDDAPASPVQDVEVPRG